MTMTIRIIWNSKKMRYDLYAKNKKEYIFVFDMPPCKNVIKFFRGIKRKRLFYEYELNSELIGVVENGESLLE